MKRVDRLAIRLLGGWSGLGILAAAGPALAQTAAAPPPASPVQAPAAAPAPEASPNAMTNLIRLLVEQKVITAEAGAALVSQAEGEAAAAQAKLATAAPTAPPPPGTVRVPYVPQLVKDEIREELRKEVVAQAKAERWAVPNSVPGWVTKVKFSGDMRFRNQSDLYSRANANDIVDLEVLNAGGPFNITPDTSVNTFPVLNTRTDRLSRLSVRARLRAEADITSLVTAGIGIASGNDTSPNSTTQLLGGGFSRKDIWLDLAYLQLRPTPYVTVSLGRFANPFLLGRFPSPGLPGEVADPFLPGRFANTFLPDDILFDEDINFDGVAMAINSAELFGRNLKIKGVGGAFPFEYIGNNAPLTDIDKNRGTGKWIFGGQLSASFESDDGFGVTGAAGYYNFHKVRGRISEPCDASRGALDCSTDWTRPAFLNKGNTLLYIRQVAVDPNNPLAPEPQLLGLLSDYNILELNGGAHVRVADDLLVTLDGLFVKNLAYDASDICRNAPLGVPITNVEETPVRDASGTEFSNTNPCTAIPGTVPIETGGSLLARYRSGGNAWMVRGTVGSRELRNQGEWNVSFAYKRIEPDSVLDSLADSDFHLGGTNAKGYVVGGSYMLFDNLRVTSRWLSANEVYGRPLSIDVLQMDLVAAF